MSQASENRQFGRKQPSKVVISSNGKVREFKIHAGLLTAIGAVFTMFMVGYLGATAYLAFRDDLVVASFIKQTRMKHEYEDRIAALRSKVDRITSRQLLDQQAVAGHVTEAVVDDLEAVDVQEQHREDVVAVTLGAAFTRV